MVYVGDDRGRAQGDLRDVAGGVHFGRLDVNDRGILEAGEGWAFGTGSARNVGEHARRTQQENDADAEAVNGGESGQKRSPTRPAPSGTKEARGRGGHQGVHGEQAEEKNRQAEQSMAYAAEVGGEEKEGQLAGCLGAETVDDADAEAGALVQVDGSHGLRVRFAGLPRVEAAVQPARRADQQGRPGLGQDRAFAPDERAQHVEREHDEGQPDQALGPAIHAARKRELEADDDRAQHGYGSSVSQGVHQAEPHGSRGTCLDAGDVGDGGDVVVVEAVAEAEDRARKQDDIEGSAHEAKNPETMLPVSHPGKRKFRNKGLDAVKAAERKRKAYQPKRASGLDEVGGLASLGRNVSRVLAGGRTALHTCDGDPPNFFVVQVTQSVCGRILAQAPGVHAHLVAGLEMSAGVQPNRHPVALHLRDHAGRALYVRRRTVVFERLDQCFQGGFEGARSSLRIGGLGGRDGVAGAGACGGAAGRTRIEASGADGGAKPH